MFPFVSTYFANLQIQEVLGNSPTKKNQHTNNYEELADLLDHKDIEYYPYDDYNNKNGFSGDGNHAFRLSEEHLIDWFQHIEHSLPNVIVPLGEDIVTSDINETPPTHIEYTFDIQVSKVDSLVNTLVEDAIYWNLRNEDSSYYDENCTTKKNETESRFYTNPYLISSLLSSLSDHLDLDRKSYTIYILNPNNPLIDYNKATSPKSSRSKQSSIEDSTTTTTTTTTTTDNDKKDEDDDDEEEDDDDDDDSDNDYIQARYGYRTGMSNSELDSLYKNAKLKFNSEWDIDSDYKFVSMFQPTKDNVEPGESVRHINENVKFKDMSRQSSEWAKKMLMEFSKYRNNTAATGSFGPQIDSCFYGSPEGNEDRWICAAPRLANHDDKQLSAVEYAQHLYNQGTWYEKFYIQTAYDNPITENCLVDSWISHKRFAFIDLTAGPFEWGPTIGGNGLKSNLTLPRVPYGTHEQRVDSLRATFDDAKELIESLQSELTIVQTVFENSCQDVDSPHSANNDNCLYLKKSIENIEALIKDQQSINNIISNKGNVDFNSPLDSMDLLLGNLMESVEDLEMNNFKAHMGSVLSDSLRHLIAQPLPLFKIKFYNRVNFHIVFITDHNKYNPRHFTMFNFDLFKYEIEKLKTPNQEFTFNIKMLSMAEDPSLALAYHTSLKTILTPTITEDGKFVTKLNYYIDSKEINEASMAATQQWQWSVGDSPNSNTYAFPFSYFTEFQIDAVQRNYIISSLERSIALTNEASNILLNHKTSASNYVSLVKFQFSSITNEFQMIREQWKMSANYLEKFQYSLALQIAIQTERMSYMTAIHQDPLE
ncbi:hypothetical protein PPL_12341 [Heterostelium album PN500]|uniref:DUF7906 domain-containing protein n=1 Tax=Heterostelium pallidum (strain ATCC 26659 / Pp 5 / PN500) TaxID=670386 RepID=D3BMC8_HETP5|nr:hypothetical protein PPL_12341 [Heterostelium album PN500]EFA77729.1 hypothetical protein PPL_12341 [Heterostelium album PN500]|eukprot:XP_020429857.1 hypothetical protein PPL_12341 [Heterostelium album PN500]